MTSGIEVLRLKRLDAGSFSIAREWTDWASPNAVALDVGQRNTFDVFGLIALAEMVKRVG